MRNINNGLETIKNQGRQDIKNLWPNIEKYWVDVVIGKQVTTLFSGLIQRKLALSLKKSSFKLSKHDFSKTVLNYILLKMELTLMKLKIALSTTFYMTSQTSRPANWLK